MSSIFGPLTITNAVTERAFWIGCYPGLTDAHVDYVIDTLHEAVAPRPHRQAQRRPVVRV